MDHTLLWAFNLIKEFWLQIFMYKLSTYDACIKFPQYVQKYVFDLVQTLFCIAIWEFQVLHKYYRAETAPSIGTKCTCQIRRIHTYTTNSRQPSSVRDQRSVTEHQSDHLFVFVF